MATVSPAPIRVVSIPLSSEVLLRAMGTFVHVLVNLEPGSGRLLNPKDELVAGFEDIRQQLQDWEGPDEYVVLEIDEAREAALFYGVAAQHTGPWSSALVLNEVTYKVVLALGDNGFEFPDVEKWFYESPAF